MSTTMLANCLPWFACPQQCHTACPRAIQPQTLWPNASAVSMSGVNILVAHWLWEKRPPRINTSLTVYYVYSL